MIRRVAGRPIPHDQGEGVRDRETARSARRIALLLPGTDWGWATETLSAYDSWVREHRVSPLITPVAMEPGEEGAFLAARQLLDRPRPPDAIFVVAARFVRGVLRAAEAAGRRVPGQLLLAAGVDSLQAREGHPPVTDSS